MRLEDLMERAAQYDENLARDIKDYVHGRRYGLVYEASKPEFVRMWKKPVVRGDIVNVLPPRGVMEDTKNEDDSSEIVYKVISISDGVATLHNEKTDETVTASVDDIVALARFDKPIYAGLKEIGRVERGGDNDIICCFYRPFFYVSLQRKSPRIFCFIQSMKGALVI